MLPEWVVDLVKGVVFTTSILAMIIGSSLCGMSRGNAENQFPLLYKQSMQFGKISFSILLPIQSLIILIFGTSFFPPFLYLGYLIMSLVLLGFVITSFKQKVSLFEVKLTQHKWLELVIQFILVFELTGFFMGATIMSISVANRL